MKQDHNYDGVFFTKGMISFYQFNEFYKIAGINGLRLFQYIRTKQGLLPRSDPGHNKHTTWVLCDNDNAQKWFGLHQSPKWVSIKKLEEAKLIEVRRGGVGKCPHVKIVCPDKLLH